MPDWYKNLQSYTGDGKPRLAGSKTDGPTIKRCAPFLDAMTTGWIIPLAADVEITSNDNADGVSYKWSFYKTMIENHGSEQVKGNPQAPKPPMKFMNYTYIKMASGYSALFLPPLNRKDFRFECIAGLVDDTYMGNGALEYINFPFFFLEPKYTGIIKAGTPLVQMIPIKRDSIFSQSQKNIKIKKMTKKDNELVTKTRARRSSHTSLYRDSLWHKKLK